MSTIQELIDGARAAGLNDPDKITWLDERDMLPFAKALFADLMVMRPDLFVGQYDLDPMTITLASVFPLEPAYIGKAQAYIVARCHMSDSEFSQSPTAALASQLFSAGFL
jgi:hypothetical protein